MKKKNLLLTLIPCLFLAACNNPESETQSSNSQNSINSEIVSSLIGVSSSMSDSLSSLDSSSLSSLGSSQNSQVISDQITDEQALDLIINAGKKDVSNAKSSRSSLLVTGYDNGNKYQQEQVFTSSSYQNDITIENGTVKQFFINSPEQIYSDTYDEVRVIEDNNYIRTRVYKNHVFKDETERVNILSFEANLIPQAFEYYSMVTSCGLGSTAYDQFLDAYDLGASFSYGSKQIESGLVLYFLGEVQSENTNQAIVFEFSYLFDSLENGFLKEYISEQSFYSLDKYLVTEDLTTLEPMYYARQESAIEKGELSIFDGEFPVDIHATFVQSIELVAPKETIIVGETIALKSEVLPATAVNKDLYFESSVPGIAKVDGDGRITGISKGTCTITATNIDSGVSASINITVEDKPAIEPGDDAKKQDLKEALTQSFYQVFAFERGSLDYGTVPFDSTSDNLGNCLFNAKVLSEFSVSEFAYDENLRKATYVGDKEKLVKVLPYEDNGVAALSNRYSINNNTVFRNVILSFDIYLSSSNTISYIIVETRNDTATINNRADFANLTTENIETELEFSVNQWGTLKSKFNSKGFAYPDEEA